MTLVVVPCIVCGGTAFKAVYPGTIGAVDVDIGLYFGSSRVRAGHLPIVRCSHCGLLMENPHDDNATLAEVYATHEDSVYELEYENRRQGALTHLALVSAFCPTPGRLLDLGCASGTFVSLAQQAGWQATGLDPSRWMVECGRARCPAATFVASTLEEASFEKSSFDVITLWDVLEHVPSPSHTLQRVRSWLVPNGSLFLSVPNAGSVVARLMRSRWVLLLREHLWYFSPRTVSLLLSQSGFEIVQTRPKLVQFSVANILRRFAQYPGALSGLSSHLSTVPACKRIWLRFPIGEMNVVARAR
jgi:SAM-dependent methyltransferase